MGKKALYLLFAVILVTTVEARDLPEFMIFTYGDTAKAGLTENMVKTLAEADFNTLYGPAEILPLCKKYGVRLMIPHPGLETIARLKGNPDVWGYDIMDEPISLKQLYEAADSVKAYHAADPTHMTFVNLNQKAGHWIRLFIDTVQPDFLSYDEYPWWYGGIYRWFSAEDPLYVKLEQHRDEAIAAGLPFTVWREVNTQRNVPGSMDRNWNTPPDNDKKIRLNIYVTLAYGAKGILWFFDPLMFDKETGQLNETGKQVAGINHELKRLGPILLPLTSTGVFHTSPVPKGSRQTTPDHWVQLVEKGLMMGTFRDKDKKEYVLAVNKDWKTARKATLQFRLFLQVVDTAEMLDRHTGEWKPLTLYEVKDTRDHEKIYNIDNIPPEIMQYITYNRKGLPPKELSFFELYHTYRPPYQSVSFTLAPGDGELVRVTFKEGQDIPDPRK